jgi:hypothetical protein
MSEECTDESHRVKYISCDEIFEVLEGFFFFELIENLNMAEDHVGGGQGRRILLVYGSVRKLTLGLSEAHVLLLF